MEYLFEYGLFLAKAVTFVAAIVIIIAVGVGAAHKPKSKKGELEVTDLSKQLDDDKNQFLEATLSKDELKQHAKDLKQKVKDTSVKAKTFVIDFKGSIDAHESDALREEISAIINIASKDDRVLVRLESGGGVVHGYGLCASQLQRIKQAGLNLHICVDKIAASGGYMMACIGDKVSCAPFAIIGSIGVIAQLPNFNKILKKNDIDFEQITAGEYKRTVTMFGENTEKAKEKFKQEIEQTHHLFKQYVSQARPELDLETVATGEHWFGIDALDKGLVDEITTSDDVLMELNKTNQLYLVKYQTKKGLSDKIGLAMSGAVESVLMRLIDKSNHLFK